MFLQSFHIPRRKYLIQVCFEAHEQNLDEHRDHWGLFLVARITLSIPCLSWNLVFLLSLSLSAVAAVLAVAAAAAAAYGRSGYCYRFGGTLLFCQPWSRKAFSSAKPYLIYAQIENDGTGATVLAGAELATRLSIKDTYIKRYSQARPLFS